MDDPCIDLSSECYQYEFRAGDVTQRYNAGLACVSLITSTTQFALQKTMNSFWACYLLGHHGQTLPTILF